MKQLDNTTFNDTISGDKPTVIDFWASWCMPCKIFAPVFEELESELQATANFAKVDIDENNDLAAKYGVTSIPTLVFFKDGEEVNRLVGVNPKEKITEILNSL